MLTDINDIDNLLNGNSVTVDMPETTLEVQEGKAQSFTIAFSEGSFGLIPEGIHLARTDSIEVKQSKTGQPYLNIKYVIAEGEHENTFVWHMLSLTPKAAGFLTTAFKAYGIDTANKDKPFLLNKNEQGFITNPELINQLVALHIKHRNYQGTMQHYVNAIMPKDKAPNSDEPPLY